MSSCIQIANYHTVLKDKHKRPILLTPSLDHTTVAFVSTRWRYQKNGDNGQIITYARNLDNPELCYVSAVIRILIRAQRLAIKPDCPVAVAMCGKKKLSPCFITSTLVASHLQAAAKVVNHIISKKNRNIFNPLPQSWCLCPPTYKWQTTKLH